MDKLGVSLTSSLEDLTLAEQIRQELLAENLAVLEKYFLPHKAQEEYLNILSRYYSGEAFIKHAYQFLSGFNEFESLINRSIDCILLYATYDIDQGSLFEIPSMGILRNKVESYGLNYLADEARNALLKYKSLLQIDDTFTLELREVGVLSGLIEISITYRFIGTYKGLSYTKHNYVFPLYLVD